MLILIFGPISGAHFNPAVTLAFTLQGAITRRDAAPFTTGSPTWLRELVIRPLLPFRSQMILGDPETHLVPGQCRTRFKTRTDDILDIPIGRSLCQ